MAKKPECKYEYALRGRQVEPAAGYWNFCPRPCVVAVETLRKLTDDPTSPDYFPPYPTDDDVIEEELDELVELSHHRDDPCALVKPKPPRPRLPISKLLNITPPPLGGVLVGRFPGEQIIRTGRGMARAVEAETPGLYHRHALNLLMPMTAWSPPRQALVWAALDVTIASALEAAWYYKWLAAGRDCTARRERPIEYAWREKKALNVLFDRPDELNPAYNLCPDVRPDKHGKFPDNASGTPRHPAYPSGHSTYSGAASELLSFFFGKMKTPAALLAHPELESEPNTTVGKELDRLADNIGMGRLWAGIHWRSDHIQGMKLGRVVARLVIQQLFDMGAVDEKGNVVAFDVCGPVNKKLKNQCDLSEKVACPDDKPPSRDQLIEEAKKIKDACGKPKKGHGPCDSPVEQDKSVSAQYDAGRGVQTS